MRFVAAFGLAMLIVLAMLVIGLRLAGFMSREEARVLDLHAVEVLDASQRRELADVLGEGEGRTPPRFPLVSDIPRSWPAEQSSAEAEAEAEAEGTDR